MPNLGAYWLLWRIIHHTQSNIAHQWNLTCSLRTWRLTRSAFTFCSSFSVISNCLKKTFELKKTRRKCTLWRISRISSQIYLYLREMKNQIKRTVDFRSFVCLELRTWQQHQSHFQTTVTATSLTRWLSTRRLVRFAHWNESFFANFKNLTQIKLQFKSLI